MPDEKALWEWSPCPACGHAAYRHHRTVESMFPELLFRKPKQRIRLVTCTACRLIYVRPRPVPEIHRRLLTKELFWGADFESYVRRESIIRGEARERLAVLAQLRPSGRLLDVGCCCGFFLDEARQAGWQTQGAEASPEFAEYARRHLHLEVLDLPAERLGSFPDPVDVVTFWGVLEYTYSPLQVFGDLQQILTPGGLAFFSLANTRSLDYLLLGGRWPWLYPPAHLVHFSEGPLIRLLQRTGFRLLRLWTEPGPEDLLASAARSRLGLRAPSRLQGGQGASTPAAWRQAVKTLLHQGYRFLSPWICRLGWGAKLVAVSQKT